MENNIHDDELTTNNDSIKVDNLTTIMFEIEQSLLDKATTVAIDNQISLQELFTLAIKSTINKNT